MESKARLFGHPIHQMLIVFPLGLLAMSLVFDLLAAAGLFPGLHAAAYPMIVAGVISGLVAAVFGLVDFLAIPGGTRAKRVGALHGAGNVVVVLLFALSALLRMNSPAEPGMIAIIASAAGAALALGTAWLGGELVNRLGVGVDDGANLNAPSSLRGPVGSRGATHGRA